MRVMLYDATQNGLDKKFLSTFWSMGSLLGSFDHVLGVESWEEAYNRLDQLPTYTGLTQLQFWGHGSSAHPWINDRSMSIADFADSLRKVVHEGSVIWFRACDIYRGYPGQTFARSITRELGCGVVAHTRIVSAPWPTHQSGGYGLLPGQLPYWDPTDNGGSTPWAPHTCLVTRMNPPESWWKA